PMRAPLQVQRGRGVFGHAGFLSWTKPASPVARTALRSKALFFMRKISPLFPLLRRLIDQCVDRAGNSPEIVVIQMAVAPGCRVMGMAEQAADRLQRYTGTDRQARIGMAHVVEAHGL